MADQNEDQELRNTLKAVLSDVKILLNYLSRQPRSVLVRSFGNANRSSPHAGEPLLVANYQEFLSKLASIEFHVAARKPFTDLPKTSDGTDGLSFLRWSRDYLATLAAPATVESIAMTRAFIDGRIGWSVSRLIWPQSVDDDTLLDSSLPLPKNLRKAGEQLAKQVFLVNFRAGWIILIVLLGSVFALSGRIAIEQQKSARAAYDSAYSKVAAFLQADSMVQKFDSDRFGLVSDAHEVAEACYRSVTSGAASAKVAVPGCEELDVATLHLLGISVHLLSWSSEVDGFPFGYLLGPIFGVNMAHVGDISTTFKDDDCSRMINDGLIRLKTSTTCANVFKIMVMSAAGVSQSILGAITFYILPCFYAYLGAVLASLGLIRIRVETNCLNYVDRSVLQQNGALGVICGVVIGLFFG